MFLSDSLGALLAYYYVYITNLKEKEVIPNGGSTNECIGPRYPEKLTYCCLPLRVHLASKELIGKTVMR